MSASGSGGGQGPFGIILNLIVMAVSIGEISFVVRVDEPKERLA